MLRYSWGHLVVPYTEELISLPFLDENSIQQLFWDHLNTWPATGGFFLRPLSPLFCLSEVCCAHRSFSRGFLQKRPKWISHQCNFAFLLCQPLACYWRVFSRSLATFELYLTGWPCPRGLARYFQADGFLSDPLFTLPKLFAVNVPFFQSQFIQFAMKIF